MADGFGTVTCGILIAKPGETARAEYTVQHIPYGNVNYIDIGGLLPMQYDVTFKFASNSDYTAMQALVGTQGTLTYNGTAYLNALLFALGRQTTTPSGVVLADASLIVP